MKKKINQWACYNRIWSWSPMLCEKHGPRASVTTKTSACGLGFCLRSPSGHVFHTAWETMIKSYIKSWHRATIKQSTRKDNVNLTSAAIRGTVFDMGKGDPVYTMYRSVLNFATSHDAQKPDSHEYKDVCSSRYFKCKSWPSTIQTNIL